jgi:hypothetical protein
VLIILLLIFKLGETPLAIEKTHHKDFFLL